MESPWPGFVIANVDAIFEGTEELRKERMSDWQSGCIRHEVFRCRVRASRRSVDEHVVPWLIAAGLCLVPEIPLVSGPAEFVEVNHDTTIAVTPVANELPGLESRL